jgi:5'/3'-nucleotidase SurE
LRILVTNDDGIHSPGLDTCEEIARTLSDDVWVVAPEHDQSGVAHSRSTTRCGCGRSTSANSPCAARRPTA